MMKQRKFFHALLSCTLLVALLSGTAFAYGEEYNGYNDSKSQQYTDVPTNYWAFNAIAVCSERGWFNGYQDGSFHPNAPIRRDEAAKVFVEALALPWSQDTPVSFTDTANSWAAGRIEAGKFLFPNATNLSGTLSFRPGQTITREEAVYALVVAWRYGSKVATCDESVLEMFADSSSISAGVRPYLAVAVSENLVSGIPDAARGTLIAAQKGLSRDEFATLLARALEHGYGPDKLAAPLESTPTPTPPVTPEETPQPKPEPKPEEKPQPKPEPKPEEKPQPKPEPKPEEKPAAPFAPERAAGEILTLVNAERTAAGLSVLTLDETVCTAAGRRSVELQTLFSHTRPNGLRCFSVLAELQLPCNRSMGENIAAGYQDSNSVMDGWMHSSGHRANILSPLFTKLGVGCSADATGRLYWVQIFYS